jgi:hypothetical protein
MCILCTIPQSLYTMKKLGLNDSLISQCKSFDSFKCHKEVQIFMVQQHLVSKIHNCRPSCHKSKHRIFPRKTSIGNQSVLPINFYYHSSRVEVLEEYLLFDFNAIVAAVGGSLGLFLGFSCLDFGYYIMDRMFHMKL